MRKFIFLDIDGVLNNTASLAVHVHLMPEKCLMVEMLCKETGAEIVISSSWRCLYSERDLGSFLFRLGLLSAYKHLGYTMRSKNGFRGREIAAWMSANHHTFDGSKYCILDDDSDFYEFQKPFHVQTNGHCGFTWRDFDKAVNILGGAE